MSLKPGSSFYGEFTTQNPSTGAAVNADSLPAAKLTRNGADDNAVSLTVANLDTGRYIVSGTIPLTYVIGDSIQVSVTATVTFITGKAVIDSFVLDNATTFTFNSGAVIASIHPSPGGGGGGPGGAVLTSASSYLTPDEFLKRCDIRYIADLIGDLGVRTGGTQPDPAIVRVNDNLIACLDDASGEVEAHALLGGRYTPLDLQSLSGMALARLQRILTTLTIVFLIQRRPDLNRPMPFMWKQVQETLLALAQGEQIFGLQNVADAGRLDHHTETAPDVESRDLASLQAQRMLGRRSNRNQPPPGGN